MIEVFLQSMLIGYSGAIMPGSLLTYTIDKSLKSGAKSGLFIALGHSLLEAVLVLLILLGLGRYLGTDTAKMIIGFAGGCVLFFFGLGMIRDAYKNKAVIAIHEKSDSQYGNLLLGGALISASNPYFIVWWAAIGLGLVMNALNTFGIIGVLLFYFGHILSDITWYVFISTLIGKTRNFINQKVYRLIIGGLGICLIVFGVMFVKTSWGVFYSMWWKG